MQARPYPRTRTITPTLLDMQTWPTVGSEFEFPTQQLCVTFGTITTHLSPGLGCSPVPTALRALQGLQPHTVCERARCHRVQSGWTPHLDGHSRRAGMWRCRECTRRSGHTVVVHTFYIEPGAHRKEGHQHRPMTTQDQPNRKQHGGSHVPEVTALHRSRTATHWVSLKLNTLMHFGHW
jgi:hypothetical protein